MLAAGRSCLKSDATFFTKQSGVPPYGRTILVRRIFSVVDIVIAAVELCVPQTFVDVEVVFKPVQSAWSTRHFLVSVKGSFALALLSAQRSGRSHEGLGALLSLIHIYTVQ